MWPQKSKGRGGRHYAHCARQRPTGTCTRAFMLGVVDTAPAPDFKSLILMDSSGIANGVSCESHLTKDAVLARVVGGATVASLSRILRGLHLSDGSLDACCVCALGNDLVAGGFAVLSAAQWAARRDQLKADVTTMCVELRRTAKRSLYVCCGTGAWFPR